VGKSEKCVDIQLAVELLFHATTEPTSSTATHSNPSSSSSSSSSSGNGAYDIAILLTGDKDFIPAIIRTRQRDKMVGLVSMRRGCNRALVDMENLCDFDVIWLEDYLDHLVVPKAASSLKLQGDATAPWTISAFTLHKVISDFLVLSNLPRVQSRDLGRYLKSLPVRANGDTLLDELKNSFGGMYQFLCTSGYYTMEKDAFREDSTDSSYWIALHDDAQSLLLEEAAATIFTSTERKFFNAYDTSTLVRDRLEVYSRTLLQLGSRQYVDISSRKAASSSTAGEIEHVKLPENLTRDYSGCTCAELRLVCRNLGLLVSGTKAVLLDRVRSHVDAQTNALTKQQDTVVPQLFTRLLASTAEKVSSHLKTLMVEYLRASGGTAGSRDIGRYMNANRSSSGSETSSALKELKSTYGNLRTFAASFPDSFFIVQDHDTGNSYEFVVALKKSTGD
jgi:SAP domain